MSKNGNKTDPEKRPTVELDPSEIIKTTAAEPANIPPSLANAILETHQNSKLALVKLGALEARMTLDRENVIRRFATVHEEIGVLREAIERLAGRVERIERDA